MSRPPVFRLDEYVVQEVDLQTAGADAFDRLILPPAQFTAFPAGHLELTGAQAARLVRIGLKPSWPDHLVLHDHLIGIEWKKPGADLSISRMVHSRRSGRPRWVEGQRDVFPRLRRAGMRGPYLCISVEQALTILEAEGVPLRRWRMAA